MRVRLRSLADVLRALTKEQNRRIIATLGIEAHVLSGFAGPVLATDAELPTELLAEGDVDGSVLLSAMPGYRDNTIEALLAAKVAPERIVGSAVRKRLDRRCVRRDPHGP